MLFAVLPSENYAPLGASQQSLLAHLVEDANMMYTDGIEAWFPQTKIKPPQFCQLKWLVDIYMAPLLWPKFPLSGDLELNEHPLLFPVSRS